MVNTSIKGNRISAYYLPDLLLDIMRLCKHFQLWTNIVSYTFKSLYKITSSAIIENDFKELKTQILRFYIQPITINRFVIKDLLCIKNNEYIIIRLFKSK